MTRSVESRQLQRLTAASVEMLPFGLAFLATSIIAPESEVVFIAIRGSGIAGSGVLDRIGGGVTEGWARA